MKTSNGMCCHWEYNSKSNRVGYLRTIGPENERVSPHENKHPIGGSYSYLKRRKILNIKFNVALPLKLSSPGLNLGENIKMYHI